MFLPSDSDVIQASRRFEAAEGQLGKKLKRSGEFWICELCKSDPTAVTEEQRTLQQSGVGEKRKAEVLPASDCPANGRGISGLRHDLHFLLFKIHEAGPVGDEQDHDFLPQINLAIIFGESSRLPVCFRKLPGDIADVTTVFNLLEEMDFLKTGRVKLVMDRGFYSKANINELYRRHCKFLLAARKSLKFVRKNLEEVRSAMVSREHYSSRYCFLQ